MPNCNVSVQPVLSGRHVTTTCPVGLQLKDAASAASQFQGRAPQRTLCLTSVLSRQNGPARSLPAGACCSSICRFSLQGGAHSQRR
ncbi:hypothetical protein OEZ85_007505 [Tetradesmus obliquus]|uniref:Uncharacterized protein n=1 Tax=Tetradesmus obliquus TaxID=3088 RepID=A0ABY8TGB4_TETOB|nr:hypothetical protein OEZ85_007505 [Tetradesmus obliquus]